jgi:hypothetical protein
MMTMIPTMNRTTLIAMMTMVVAMMMEPAFHRTSLQCFASLPWHHCHLLSGQIVTLCLNEEVRG